MISTGIISAILKIKFFLDPLIFSVNLFWWPWEHAAEVLQGGVLDWGPQLLSSGIYPAVAVSQLLLHTAPHQNVAGTLIQIPSCRHKTPLLVSSGSKNWCLCWTFGGQWTCQEDRERRKLNSMDYFWICLQIAFFPFYFPHFLYYKNITTDRHSP